VTTTDLAELRFRTELLKAHRDLARLRAENEQLVATNRDLSAELTAATQSGGELLRMIVAFRQLVEAGDAEGTLRSVADILINIVGTEDFAVLMITDGPALHAVIGMGPAFEQARRSPTTRSARSTARSRVVPLLIADHVVGAIVIDSLLPHRHGFSAADEQVLGLLSTFAATALVAAQQRPGWTCVNVTEVA
jgi:GAF domain-containing protein